VAEWFEREILDTGRAPLFLFFVGMVLGFLFIRMSVRMIRAGVRWWPGNVTPGGLHIHHLVFGFVFMLVSGVAGLAIQDELVGWRSALAGVFGVGAALVLDEFALILHLDDVYWTEQGRASIDAVFVAVAVTGLLLLGLRPAGLDDLQLTGDTELDAGWRVAGAVLALVNLTLAMVTLLKGKLWTGLIGLFVVVLLLFGAIRLARPGSPWARWRYHRPGRRPAAKLARATWREQRIRAPMIRAKIWVQELVGGRPDQPPALPDLALAPPDQPPARPDRASTPPGQPPG
jgi:hypothetical protein